MRRLVVLAVLILALSPQTAPAQEGPRLFIEKKLYDFGEVTQGRPVKHVFVIKNLGKAPLSITKIKPSCVCTIVKKPKAIPAGQSADLEVHFDSSTRVGMQNFQLLLFSNDAQERDMGPYQTVLRLRGEVLSRFKIDPPFVSLGRLVQGEEVPARSFTIRSKKAGKAFKLLSFEENKAGFRVAKLEALKDGGYRVTVDMDSKAKRGRYRSHLFLRTDDKYHPRVAIPVFAEMGSVFGQPQFLSFESAQAGQKMNFSIERMGQKLGLKILSIDYDRTRFQLRQRVVRPGKHVDFEMTVKDSAPLGAFAGRLVINVAEKREPRLIIPVSGSLTGRLAIHPKAVFVEAAVKKGQELARLEVQAKSLKKEWLLGVFVNNAPAHASLEFQGSRCFIVVKASKDAGALEFEDGQVVLSTRLAQELVHKIDFITDS